ncbi:50S ribosomal protein L2 [Thermoplasma sp.]|uniref:50S ribosomal protein L2 n=1 Tax=Thermoplasma sp. TaxID=1973142 RepID=UPI00261C8765|nr:50S ribosomal protein L2 [Thermoplasma sp.]
MGKHIIPQRRGHGSLVYRSPSHRHLADIKHVAPGSYVVKDIIHAPGRNAPLLELMGNDGKKAYQIAFTGAYVGQNIVAGNVDSVAPGTTTVLANIPDGSYVYNIESSPGDGGEFCRSAGTFALVVSHGQHVTLKLPSGRMRDFDPRCRATVGVVAASGLKDPPILKAGTHVHYLRSKAKRPYTVRGVAMNAVNHPHGGGNHQHVGRPSTVGRNAPPGRKVGRLSPKRRRVNGR